MRILIDDVHSAVVLENLKRRWCICRAGYSWLETSFLGIGSRAIAEVALLLSKSAGPIGDLAIGRIYITCPRSRSASALFAAIQMPRRSAPALWGQARPLEEAKRAAKTRTHLMFLIWG